MLSKEERIKNIIQANERSHKNADRALKEALYNMLQTQEINEIKITDLIKLAKVSRGTYYKHYYYLTDLLKDDLDEIINSVIVSLTPSLHTNWLMVFNIVYEYKNKLALIYKAGLSIAFLKKLNDYSKTQGYKDNFVVWNGIVFNAIYNWGLNGFDRSPQELADEMTEITMPFFTETIKKEKIVKIKFTIFSVYILEFLYTSPNAI